MRAQIAEALARRARALIDPREFERDEPGTPYLARGARRRRPGMRVMTEESFGPVVGIGARGERRGGSFARMNDSEFGLTASGWTREESAALAIGTRVETGTFFMNRCDYLGPPARMDRRQELGRGCSLSPWASSS